MPVLRVWAIILAHRVLTGLRQEVSNSIPVLRLALSFDELIASSNASAPEIGKQISLVPRKAPFCMIDLRFADEGIS